MEERSRSGGYSDRVVKNKNSSGCLIIKKKPNGSDAVGSSASQKMYELKKDKKRPPAVIGDSSSSDDELLEVYRRRGVSRGNRVAGGSVAYKKGIIEDNEFSRKRKKSEFRQVNFGKNEVREGGRKRSKLDVYEFDEYDDLTDVEMRGKGQFGGREVDRSGRRFLGVKPAMDAGSRREFETGSTRHNVIPRGESSFLGSSSSEKIGIDGSLVNERFESKTKVPITMLKERFGSPDEAIRLQGKNGVLKLMVNHKNKVNGPLEPQNCKEVGGNSAVSLSKEMTQKNIILHHSSFAKKPNTFDKVEKEKSRSQKLLPVNSRDSSEESSEGSDAPSKNVKVRRSIKRGRSEVGRTPPERLQPARLKEAKVKRGSGTEKQLLREKIRSMLVSAGWTIDYRPRRNRDYCDAVYINPTGTAYWSIIKAYDALQKQLDDVGADTVNDYSPFAPISEEVLSKLTRQTQRKIEKELKRKKKDNVKGKRKREAAAGMLVSCEDDTESSDSGRFEEKLSSFIKQNGKSMKSRSHEAHYGDAGNSTSKERERFPLHGRKSKKIGRCTLLVRNSEKGLNSEDDGFVPYKGKRTVLSWLIDSGTVKLSEKVHYMNRRRSRIMLEGWITRDGIHCGCCSKILTVSKFEIHAASKLRQMFQNIYLSSGISLLQCQLDAWDRQDESLRRGFHMIDTDGDDPDDDTCGICGDGGDLICCDGCPSTFHQNCLDIEMLPPGDWRCPHCSCKICCQVEVSTAEGNGTILDALLTCYLCERKYHNSCMKGKYGASVSSSTSSLSFCGVKCQEIFEQLQKLLGVKHELEAGLSWSLIHRTDVDSDTSLQGLSHRVEWNSKLAVALTVMDECFLPIIDRRSGINLIHNVVYNCGSNFNRLNYSGFYTAILERGDEIISAASIRIHGPELAEMPYIGTRHIYRRQGMFRRLFSAVESALRSLKVEKLIIPAISELMHTWTTVFRFSAVEESQKQEMKSINMLVFPGTDILQKNLVEQETLKLTGKGTVSPEVDVIVPDSTDKSDLDASPGDGAAVERDLLNDLINRQSTGDSSLHGHGASLNESSALGASLDASNEAKPQIPLEGSQVPDSTDKSDLDASPGDGAAVERDLLNDLINHQSTADSSLHGHGASLNESSSLGASLDASNEAKPQIPLEGSQGNPSSISELEDKSEFVRYVNIQYISEASIEVPELGKPSVDSPPKHDIEVSTDCKEDPATVTQEEKVAYADSGSEPGCLSLNSTSFRNTPLHVSDATKQPSEGTTHSTSGLVDELVSEVKDSFALNASHGALVEKPVLDPPIGGNIEQPLLECEGDDAHEVGEKKVADSGSVSTAQDLFVNDASDVKYCLKTYCGTKLEVSNQETVCSHSLTQEKPAASPADLNHGTPPNESHQVVELDRPQPDSCVEIGVRWPSAESGVDPAEEVNFGVDSSGPVCDSFDAHSAENFEMHIANE